MNNAAFTDMENHMINFRHKLIKCGIEEVNEKTLNGEIWYECEDCNYITRKHKYLLNQSED